jgi:hypothetical protein
VLFLLALKYSYIFLKFSEKNCDSVSMISVFLLLLDKASSIEFAVLQKLGMLLYFEMTQISLKNLFA